MIRDLDCSLPLASYTSEDESARREFYDSVRVKASPTPSPLSETQRDFQLVCAPTELLNRSDTNSINLVLTSSCYNCHLECRQSCCVSINGLSTAKAVHADPRSGDESADKKPEGVCCGQDERSTCSLEILPTSAYPEHDKVSLDSNDSIGLDHLRESGGRTPLLPPDEPGGPTSTVVTCINNTSSPTCSLSSSYRNTVRCSCHVKVVDKTAKKAKIRLVLASVIALVFMLGEVLGGYFSGSLAIMTDAAHMLSDFAGFLISLFAIWLGSRPSSSRMSFGWHRAEVVGAVVSVLIIWVITGVLLYEAILRVMHPIEINADIMLITACIGVFVNVFMCMVLHPHSHGHGHSNKRKRSRSDSDETGHEEGSIERDCEAAEESGRDSGRVCKQKFWQRLKRKKHINHGHEENINVRAAFIHVLGDLMQSVGVVIAGYIIWFFPKWTIADPICTFIFCILVLISTLNVLKDALRVLMEGTPKHINYMELKEDLEDVSGVRKAHSLHIWSLTLNRTALAAHLVIESSANHQSVLNKASQMLKERYDIASSTLQVEDHHDLMEECGTCQETDKAEFCNFVCWPL